MVAEPAPADDGAAEDDEGVVDAVADPPADAQSAEPVQQGERAFHDPPVDAQAGAVLSSAPSDHWGDLQGPELAAVNVVVVAAACGVSEVRLVCELQRWARASRRA